MSEALFVLTLGACAGVVYCACHAVMLWWYRRVAQRKFDRMAARLNRTRPWWVDREED